MTPDERELLIRVAEWTAVGPTYKPADGFLIERVRRGACDDKPALTVGQQVRLSEVGLGIFAPTLFQAAGMRLLRGRLVERSGTAFLTVQWDGGPLVTHSEAELEPDGWEAVGLPERSRDFDGLFGAHEVLLKRPLPDQEDAK
jgi:hypothetical protein